MSDRPLVVTYKLTERDVGRRFVLQFRHDALGDFRSDPRRARHRGAVAHGDGGGKLGRLERAQDGERNLRADTLYGLQQPEPFALDIAEKAEQPDLILAHVRFDGKRCRLSGAGQFLQRARGAMHEIADTVDVEDDRVLAIGLDDALELADHGAPARRASISRLIAAVRIALRR